jgi:hypothetical protein
MFTTFFGKILQAHSACRVMEQTETDGVPITGNDWIRALVLSAVCSGVCAACRNNLCPEFLAVIWAQALGRRHKRDVYNTFFAAELAFNG